MEIYRVIIDVVLFGLLFLFPLLIYINLRRYKTAALSLLFSKKSQTIRAFQFFAVAMIIYAISTVFRIVNDIYAVTYLSWIYLIVSIILTLFLIYVFYKLYRIMKI
jgi:hypothetical protein